MIVKLKIKLLQYNISTLELATKLGISLSATYRRLHGDVDFTREELIKLKSILNLTDLEFLDIFFNSKAS